MHPFIRRLLIAALLLSPASALRAQTAVDPTGHWDGAVQVPGGMQVKFEIDLAKNGKGELAGTFSNAGQHLNGLPLSNVAVDGASITFQIKGAPGERAFDGSLSADGKSIGGDYRQGGFTVPFTMTRTGDARIDPPVRNAPIGKELEGTWKGTLDANGIQRQLVLTMMNQPDGATASIVNVDEGLDIPVAAITQKASTVMLDVKAVGASFSGALNTDGTELAGTFTMGPGAMPVTFRLVKP